MNWRLSALDGVRLLSNSDAHSPSKIGREANIFATDISYPAIMTAIKTGQGMGGTIEFFPQEGKYHYDGHRNCHVSLTPKETIGHNFRCPACGKKVTVGVMHRVEELADRDENYRPVGAPGYQSIIPLQEIISETVGVGVNSKAVTRAYGNVIEKLGSEFTVLMDTPLEDIGRAASPQLMHAIGKMRRGDIHIEPGYDGEFGKVRIFDEAEIKKP